MKSRQLPDLLQAETPLQSSSLAIEVWPLERVKPYPRNARRISDAAVTKVADSIRTFGWRQPIVVEPDGTIIIGHVRRLAAIKLGLTEVPVHVATDLDPAKIRALRLADNRSHDEAKWDAELLGVELSELAGMGVDLSTTAFDGQEIDRILDAAKHHPEDDVVEPPVVGLARSGDLWLLGKHRLLCGDCSVAEDVKRVVASPSPRLMVTDPPYGVELDMEWRDRKGLNKRAPAAASYMLTHIKRTGASSISSDTRRDWSKAYELVPSLEVAYVWHASLYTIEVGTGLIRTGFELRQQIIWTKPVAAFSRSHYHWRHEPCWYAVKKGKTATWVGSKDQNTVWEAHSPKQIMGKGRQEDKTSHPTQKPLDLMRRPIVNHTKRGDAVYEPFAGSGTTLIACENAKRVCYAIEIDPRFVDVILDRWEKVSGAQAVLESDGRSWSVVRAERANPKPPKKGKK